MMTADSLHTCWKMFVLLLVSVLALRADVDLVLEQDVVATVPVPELEHAMVEVRVARISADRMYPWRNSAPHWQTGYAVAIKPGVFLTLEPLVRNHATIQIRGKGSLQSVPARVVLSDPRVGLALIAPEEPHAFPDVEPLAELEQIPQDGDFTIVQWGENDQIQVGLGSLLSVGYASIGDGVPPQLTYQLASSVHVSSRGTPILHAGKLAGLASPYQAGQKSVFVLSPDTIARFLAASRRPAYAGIPEPDFEVSPLADPVRRRFLGVSPDQPDRGVYVASIEGHAPDTHALQPQDVLLVWDGQKLDARGNYTHPWYGSIPFQHLFASRTPQDLVPATVVRDGQVQDIAVRVRSYDAVDRVIPENAIEAPDHYVVAAGLVFRELSWDFLESVGQRWQRRMDIDLIWQASVPPERPDTPAYRTVILVSVLADPINIGYRDLRFQIVTHINGRAIENLQDLAARIDQEGLSRVALKQMQAVPLVFDPEDVTAADARIQQRFQIPALRRLSE